MTTPITQARVEGTLEPLVRLAMSMYTGEKCQGCGKTFDTVESLHDSVWWPWKEGRVGHKACYEKANAAITGGGSRPVDGIVGGLDSVEGKR